jgi:hypothetical protein
LRAFACRAEHVEDTLWRRRAGEEAAEHNTAAWGTQWPVGSFALADFCARRAIPKAQGEFMPLRPDYRACLSRESITQLVGKTCGIRWG